MRFFDTCSSCFRKVRAVYQYYNLPEIVEFTVSSEVSENALGELCSAAEFIAEVDHLLPAVTVRLEDVTGPGRGLSRFDV